MKILIKNIKQLLGIDADYQEPLRSEKLANVKTIEDAFLITQDDKIEDFGIMREMPSDSYDHVIDAQGKLLMPAFCDSHSHLVFYKSRAGEFVDRIKGLTYQEIAAKGGGILNSANKLMNASEEQLLEDALKRVEEVIQYGTGAIEMKSGYGLSVEAELKILRIIKKLKALTPLQIKATFLGAHAIPKVYKNNRDGYIQLIINEMLPIIKEENLADYVDVFCETNYFTVEEMDAILKASAEIGLKPKVHVNQFTSIGGIENAIKNNAVSVDHLEVMKPSDFDLLAKAKTIATLLPSCSFFINIPYADARKMIDRDIAIALASDFNPGSTPSYNMQLVWSLACIKQNLLPTEAFNALTINGAFAMEVQNVVGSIKKGKHANLLITKQIDSIEFIPYNFGANDVDQVILSGEIISK